MTFSPGSTGRTHAAASTRAPVSTTQSRHTPTGVSFCKWHSVGIEIPCIRAASNTVVPVGTLNACPSIVISTDPVGVVVTFTDSALSLPFQKPSPSLHFAVPPLLTTDYILELSLRSHPTTS